MATILVDTDVVSYLLKGDSRAATYSPLIQGKHAALSFMTVAELFQWAATREWGARRVAALEQALTLYLVIPPDGEMCRIWGRIRAERQSAGQPISPQDAWIAATALRHSLPLLTHNTADFQGIANLDLSISPSP